MNKLYALSFFMIFCGLCSQLGAAQDLRPLTADEGQVLQRLHQPRRLVLAIGITEFEDPFWNKLQYAADDAGKIYRTLTQDAAPAFDGGELLSSENAPGGRVGRTEILAALQRLKAHNLSEDDVIIVYLSTHGTIFHDKKSGNPIPYAPYFVASDTQHRDIEKSALSRSELLDFFQSLRSQRKALIIATCHAGGGKAQLTPEIRLGLERLKGDLLESTPRRAGKGFAVMAASSWSEAAAEDHSLKQDIYTHFLLEAMRVSQGRSLTLSQAHDYATQKTVQYTQGRQHPTIQIDQAGGDPIVLSGASEARGMAFLYSYLEELRNFQIHIGGLNKGAVGASNLLIPEGKHRLEVVDPESERVILSRVVRVKAGKEYSLSELIEPRRRWHLAAGLGSSRFFSPALERAYAADATSFYRLGLTYDEALSTWDMKFEFSASSWQKEQVFFASEGFAQKRRTARLKLGLGGHEVLHFFPGQGRLKSEWGWYIGPSVLYFERKIIGEGRLAAEAAQGSTTLPGVGVGINLSLQQLASGLEWGLAAHWEAYQSQGLLAGGGSAALLGSIAATMGVAW